MAKCAVILFMTWLLFVVSVQGEPLRVACVGNSITYGAGISDVLNDSYPGQLQKLLGDDYVVGNFGNSGRTMLKKGDYPIWVEKEFKGAIEMNPNLVIILLGTNDTKPYNWIYKDEYIPDYLAMIDTFRTLPANPQIYICKPPPAFSVQWDIRDSVITADIIPMIEQIAAMRPVSIIDYYTPLTDKRSLFPDDIHPNVEGAWEMAKIAYKALTGKEVMGIQDVDLARYAAVTVFGTTLENGAAAVDGNHATPFVCEPGGGIVVDLGEGALVDMFQSDFGKTGADFGCRYTIEISDDLLSWNTVVDRSASSDSSLQVAVDAVAPIAAKYVRATLLGRTGAMTDEIECYDFKVLKSAAIHAPILRYQVTDIRPQYVKVEILVESANQQNEYLKLYTTTDPAQPLTATKGYRRGDAANQVVKSTVKPGQVRWYWAKSYQDGLEVGGVDTLKIDYSISSVKTMPETPVSYNLGQNYPNPFNPQTNLPFSLDHSACVSLKIFDLQGHLLRSFGNAVFPAGHFTFEWDGRDLANRPMPSGVYFYGLELNGHRSAFQKMILIR